LTTYPLISSYTHNGDDTFKVCSQLQSSEQQSESYNSIVFIIAELVITRINTDGLGIYLFYLKCTGSGTQQIFSM